MTEHTPESGKTPESADARPWLWKIPGIAALRGKYLRALKEKHRLEESTRQYLWETSAEGREEMRRRETEKTKNALDAFCREFAEYGFAPDEEGKLEIPRGKVTTDQRNFYLNIEDWCEIVRREHVTGFYMLMKLEHYAAQDLRAVARGKSIIATAQSLGIGGAPDDEEVFIQQRVFPSICAYEQAHGYAIDAQQLIPLLSEEECRAVLGGEKH